MAPKSRLKQAIAAEKGIDFQKIKENKKAKETLKRKKQDGGGALNRAQSDSEDDDEEIEQQFDLDGVDDSDTSESSIEMDKKIVRKAGKKQAAPVAEAEEDEDEEEEEDEEDIPISDLEDLDDEDREDLIPHTRLTINNTSALLAALDRISLPTDKKTPFSTYQTIISTSETAESIPDVSDDLQRELAFYSQCLNAAQQGRAKLLAEGVPFSRPKDYFAEMVKEDAHMEKIKAKLVEEASSKKAAAEARKLRDLKKFGKQVQVAKLQERQKAKRETLEKIKTLKRKRQESGGGQSTNEGDIFDVAVDNEIGKSNQHSAGSKVNHKRVKKNEKYGFGGKKRHAKSGDAMSSGDLSSFNAKKMKAKSNRPGKGRRKAMASR